MVAIKRSPTEAFDLLKKVHLSMGVAKEIFNGFWCRWRLRSTTSVGFCGVGGDVDGWSRLWRSKRSPTEAFDLQKEIQLSVVVAREIFNGYWLRCLRRTTSVGFGFGFSVLGFSVDGWSRWGSTKSDGGFDAWH